MLLQLNEKLQKRKEFKTEKSTVYRVYEVHEEYGKDASGQTPVILTKEEIEANKTKK